MRLIDADKLHPDCISNKGGLAISQSQIANAETIEQETGEWIFDESDGSTSCSKCTCVLWFKYNTWRCKFCPNCGIKMK
jgi:hypothetical protein